MAKYVKSFRGWAADPAHDERKLNGLMALSACCVGTYLAVVWYRSGGVGLKTWRIDFTKTVM